MVRSRPKTWSDAARELGLEVLSREEHASRWRSSLEPGSTLFRSLGREVPAAVLSASALDAAGGLSFEVEQLQRSCFGRSWERRRTQFFSMCRSLALDSLPPPGVSQDAWLAVKKVVEGGYEDWGAVARELPDEHALLARLERSDPTAYTKLLSEVLEHGAELDERARPRVVRAKRDLDSGTAFREMWQRVFGPGAGVQPRAPRNLAVLVLKEAGLDVRATGLFVAYLGLTQTAIGPDLPPEVLEERLVLLDGEVHNAQKVWRQLGHGALAPGAAGPESVPRLLVQTVEWLTWERLADHEGQGTKGSTTRR